MKKLLFTFLLLPLYCFAQPSANTGVINSQNNGNKQTSVTGYIQMPVLMKINVTLINNKDLVLNKIGDYNDGKEATAYAGISIKSSRPWIVSIMSGGKVNSFHNNSSKDVSPSIFCFKESSSQQYICITNKPQQLLRSTNSNIENNYIIDMKINPGYGIQAGTYSSSIIFTLTPQ